LGVFLRLQIETGLNLAADPRDKWPCGVLSATLDRF